MNKTSYVHHLLEDCSGCGACLSICPKSCITMESDSEGFLYPTIDNNTCIDCNRCRNLCDKAKESVKDHDIEIAFVTYSKDNSIRQNSSSGGLFSELAGHIIDSKNGVIYGAAFSDEWSVKHKSVSDQNALKILRGSKYVQSELYLCYNEIRERLEQGECVYFSGTPCQVDGLLSYLNKDYNNLITQDFICHGVPSPAVWKAYVNIRSEGDRIRNISFRDKSFGWHFYSLLIETNKKRYVKRFDEDVYMRLFIGDVTLRPSCYKCYHKHLHRKADITLADCWGETYGLKDDDSGISLAFANTKKGLELINEIKDKLSLSEIPFETASCSQKMMTTSVEYNPDRERFFSLANEKGMKYALTNWYHRDILKSLKRKINYYKFSVLKRIKD